jgi:integrase
VPDHLTDQDWRDYAKARFALGKSAWTVHTEMTRLWSCFTWAVANKKLSSVPVHWICSRGPSRKVVLTFLQARALIAGAGDHHVYIFILLAFATGARHKAILDLTWARVDWDANTIQYDEGRPVDPMSKRWTKTRATVPMSAFLRAELKKAFEGAQTQFVIEHGGKRLKSIREGFANAVERAGLGHYEPHPTKPGVKVFATDITPHTIRHTVNTWLRERGVGPEDRSQLLGHLDIKVNMKEYTHAAPAVLNTAVGLLDEAIATLPQRDVPKRVAGTKRGAKKRVLSPSDKTDEAQQ